MTSGRLRRRWVKVDGHRIHVREGIPAIRRPGSPTIVLVHGFVISSRYMRPFAASLARRGWQTIAPDLPGFGLSDGHGVRPSIDELARWLRRSIEAAGVEPPAILIGNSMGCQVAVRLAVREPHWGQRLVLVGPTFDPSASLARHALRLLADLPRERLILWAEHVPDYVRAGPRRVVATLREAWAHQIQHDLPRVHAPVLVVRGSRDPIAPARWVCEAADLAADGYRATVPGAPHATNYSAPDALADTIGAFLG